MRVFLTGGTGFIGGHLLARLLARGHTVRALVRRAESAEQLQTAWGDRVEPVVGQFTDPDSWTAHLADCEVLVNTIGIIREERGATFDDVHTRAPIAAFDAAVAAGARKIVQLSALGADASARAGFHRTKRAADKHLDDLDVDHVVFRPSFVYGPGDMSTTMLTAFAAQPVTLVPDDGQMRLQPIHVHDLVDAMVDAVEYTRPERRVFDVGGPRAIAFDELLDILGRHIAGRPARKFHVPPFLMTLAAAWTDAVGVGPITGDELSMLRRGNTCDIGPFKARFDISPRPLETALARRPRSQAARWHARLSPWRIPIRASVAFIWLATAFVSAFVYPYEDSLKLLADVGVHGLLADVALYGTCALEAVIGIATLIGWRVRVMAAIQLALMAGFTAILTLGTPEMWIHPFGPLTKNIPLIGATIAMIALED